MACYKSRVTPLWTEISNSKLPSNPEPNTSPVHTKDLSPSTSWAIPVPFMVLNKPVRSCFSTIMVRISIVVLLTAALGSANASSISIYYNKQCGGTVNSFLAGSTPAYCNTQMGSSIGYTLESACALVFYSDNNCQHQASVVGRASKGRKDFPAASWLFHC